MRADRRLIPSLIAAAALFGVPGCTFTPGAASNFHFDPGPLPQSSAIFCDIEKLGNGWDNTSRVCADAASADVRNSAVPMTSAALALNTGQTSTYALDKSAAAVSRCGADGEIVQFEGPYPQGTSQCINCGAQIGSGKVYPDANYACVALCQDVAKAEPAAAGMTDTQLLTFCNDHTIASTNVPVTGCPMGFEGACTDGGVLRPDFTDPRAFPEPVSWTDLIGVAPGGTANNDLTRTLATDGSSDAGADSQQVVTSGDAFLEFSASDTSHNHVIGFSVPPCALPCADTNPNPSDVTYLMNLSVDGNIRIAEHNNLVMGPGINGTWGTYGVGDRFRITLLDRGDGHFDVRWSRLIGTCTSGMPCNEQVLTTFQDGDAYPARVDASLDTQGVSLVNVLLMRIIP